VSAAGLDDIRRRGGVTLNQAFVRNMGTCRLEAKIDVQGRKLEDVSIDARHSGGLLQLYFGRAGALRKLTRSPTSVGFRIGQARPCSCARSIIRGPCRHKAALSETVCKLQLRP